MRSSHCNTSHEAKEPKVTSRSDNGTREMCIVQSTGKAEIKMGFQTEDEGGCSIERCKARFVAKGYL